MREENIVKAKSLLLQACPTEDIDSLRGQVYEVVKIRTVLVKLLTNKPKAGFHALTKALRKSSGFKKPAQWFHWARE